jgi:NTE family protein
METVPSDPSASFDRETVLVDLALQGGGSHGAFTWGVFDRPVERQGTPRSAREILDRLNEVFFNATLLKELRMIALLRQVADVGTGEGALWAGMRIHFISSPTIDKLGASSKFNAEWDFLSMLRDEGRRCAESFLTAHHASIGKHSTLNLDVLLEQV